MSVDRPAKLGMGLQALLGEAGAPRRPSDVDAAPSIGRGGVREIDLAQIKPSPTQPRVYFDEEALDELAESIRQRGVNRSGVARGTGTCQCR